MAVGGWYRTRYPALQDIAPAHTLDRLLDLIYGRFQVAPDPWRATTSGFHAGQEMTGSFRSEKANR